MAACTKTKRKGCNLGTGKGIIPSSSTWVHSMLILPERKTKKGNENWLPLVITYHAVRELNM